MCFWIGDELKCGGLKGFECPTGYVCVDDESDTCDPEKGGRDCIGVCQWVGISAA